MQRPSLFMSTDTTNDLLNVMRAATEVTEWLFYRDSFYWQPVQNTPHDDTTHLPAEMDQKRIR